MITFFGQTYLWSDPEVLVPAGVLLLVLLILVLILRAVARAGRASAPVLHELGWLSNRVQALSDGQQQLAGG